jgi:integrase
MGRKKKWPPSIHRHRGSERAYVRIDNHDHYLGAWDVARNEPSAEARAAYARLVARLAAGQTPTPSHAAAVTTVEDVAAAWYDQEGPRLAPKQLKLVRLSLKPLIRLYGPTDAASFDAGALEALQLACATGSWLTEEERTPRPGHWRPMGDWCANVVNQRVGYVKGVWRWAERRKLVPAGSWANLRTVPGLRKGDRRVRHTARRRPATWDEVRAVARNANPPVRDALLLAWWTGLRPAEAYTMTPGELDRSGDVWVYRPGKHKGEHLDRTRQVAIGPRGQAILRPWLARASSPDAVLFRPVGRPGQRPPASYNEDSFSKAVGVAAKKAGLKGITSYCIRHAFRLRVTRGANLDAARAAMGHSSVAMSGEYAAAQDLETAKKVAREQG